MLDKIVSILQQECGIGNNNRLFVGVSGGPDSLCLLHVLRQAGYPIIAVHVNHGLRPEADAEAQVVHDAANNLGIEFISCNVNVIGYSKQHSISIEEAARVLRYQSLFEQAEKVTDSAVVVAHTADDQVETILLHLIRGTGLTGLRGMDYRVLPNPWSEEIPLLRPFLSIWRTEIQTYIEERRLNPIIDASNLDVSILRNRIRHELLPLLESYNPSFRQAIFRMAESLKGDSALLQQVVEQAWAASIVTRKNRPPKLQIEPFLQNPRSIQRLVLRKAIGLYLPGLRDVGFDCIERGLMVLSGDIPGNRTDLLAGLYLQKEGRFFQIVSRQADLSSDFPTIQEGKRLSLRIPGRRKLPGGWYLDTEEINDLNEIHLRSQENNDPYQVWMDLNDIPQPLYIRARNTGDRIRLLGLNSHTTKISDLMINLKVPYRSRATWPLVCSRDEVLWMPGYRSSEQVRIRPETRRAIHMRLCQL